LYDAERTAELFCATVNRLRSYTPQDIAAPAIAVHSQTATCDDDDSLPDLVDADENTASEDAEASLHIDADLPAEAS
jgi:hypothetical protein